MGPHIVAQPIAVRQLPAVGGPAAQQEPAPSGTSSAVAIVVLIPH